METVIYQFIPEQICIKINLLARDMRDFSIRISSSYSISYHIADLALNLYYRSKIVCNSILGAWRINSKSRSDQVLSVGVDFT